MKKKRNSEPEKNYEYEGPTLSQSNLQMLMSKRLPSFEKYPNLVNMIQNHIKMLENCTEYNQALCLDSVKNENNRTTKILKKYLKYI